MPAKLPKKRRTRVTLTRTSEVLDVRMTAELLMVSPDTVYGLFKRGELPGRKVGRKWITTRNAVLPLEADTLRAAPRLHRVGLARGGRGVGKPMPSSPPSRAQSGWSVRSISC